MTQLPTVKVVVLGSKSVGKSAVIVRFLTRRYIGEYKSNSDHLYKQSLQCDNSSTNIEILDVSRWPTIDGVPNEHIRWADAFVVIYDICVRSSFIYAQQCLQAIRNAKSPSYVPVILLANKKDLEHSRQIEVNEGHNVSGQLGCQFAEVSAADSLSDVNDAFQSLIKEARTLQVQRNIPRHRKISIAVVSKAFGAMFGKGHHQHNKNVSKNNRRMSFSL